MLTSHEERALAYRTLAAEAHAMAISAALGQVQERHLAAAARWEALAGLEELYVRNADARRSALAPAEVLVADSLPG